LKKIGASTTAGDVIEMIEAEGSFKDFAGINGGGWMVFEVAQDFGMGTSFFIPLSFVRYVRVCSTLSLNFYSRTPHKGVLNL
jgi:hypothetical protein